MCADFRTMAKTRALITDTERERLAGLSDVEEIKVYQAKSRVRRRIQEELTFDVEILEEHHPDLLEELREVVCADTENQQNTSESTEPREPPQKQPEPTPDTAPGFDGNVDQRVREAVEDVASSWEDSEERLETRRKAASVVLEHALTSGGAVGKSSQIVEDARRAFQVEGQNEETYWRKNIRPVLKKYGTYNQGKHGYMVDSVRGEQ